MFGIPSKALRNDGISALMLVWFLIAIGLVSLLIPAWAQALTAGRTAALTVIGVGLFLAGASTVAGSLVGFLFGVPQYRRPDHSATRPNTDSTTTPNTNLEQISDWLTKIIVGVGLTQLPAIGRFFNLLGQEWGPVFGAMPAGKIIAVCLTVHYFVMGFFQGFLLSSLWLPGPSSGHKSSQWEYITRVRQIRKAIAISEMLQLAARCLQVETAQMRTPALRDKDEAIPHVLR